MNKTPNQVPESASPSIFAGYEQFQMALTEAWSYSKQGGFACHIALGRAEDLATNKYEKEQIEALKRQIKKDRLVK